MAEIFIVNTYMKQSINRIERKLYFIILYLNDNGVLAELNEADDYMGPEPEDKPVVEVRAVFINCQLEDLQGGVDTDASRFQREELFKHNVLRDCKKKLALALKVSSEPDQNSDEYIPIDHISDGVNKKRVRLLNPYVLRLRWDSPLQAYKLRRIDTVTGVLTSSNENYLEKKENKYKKSRLRRESVSKEVADKWSQNLDSSSSIYKLKHEDECRHSYSDFHGVTTNISTRGSKDCVQRDSCREFSLTNHSRDKRHEHNVMIEPLIEQTINEIKWRSDPHSSSVDEDSAAGRDALEGPARIPLKYVNHEIVASRPKISETKNNNDLSVIQKEKPSMKNNVRSELSKLRLTDNGQNIRQSDLSRKIDKNLDNDRVPYRSIDNKRSKIVFNNLDTTEKNFAVYEIGNPDLWYNANVQLYEKLTTPQGKTVWNDLTKGETVKISSLSPEWATQDVNIRYRPTEWIARDDFSLPFTSTLCLLVPLIAEKDSGNNFKNIKVDDYSKEYIIVPLEDLVAMDKKEMDLNKRSGNISESSGIRSNRPYHRMLVRVSRALLVDGKDNINIVTQETDRYLTLPHRKPHQIQINVEARADDNELIIVGLKARDCGPELSNLMNKKNNDVTIGGPILLPPRHTRQLSLELPTEVPGGMAHCSVALINDEDEAVAVRDVTIKKADRCFCVWHCDCVCLSDDPKLQCREMTEMQQAAAGLTVRKKSRQVRSVCYPDVQYLDICAVIIGVISFLLFLGLVKACVGLVLRCVGSWGLQRVVKMPRKLSRYYETSLSDSAVQYDDEGWPVHPHTKQRTVRMISKYMEFILNLGFFLIIPGIIVCDAVTRIKSRCKSSPHSENKGQNKNTKTCFSTVDLQGLERRRRTPMRRWMSPEAQDLSTNIWHEGLNPQQIVNCDFMRPLLREEFRGRMDELPSSCVDSEQDDTDYVLMQMQESRESLARTQKKIDSNSPSARKQDKTHVRQVTGLYTGQN